MELMRQSYTITRDRGTVIAKALYARKAVRYSTGFVYRNIKDVPGASPVDVFFCDDGTTIITFTDIIAFSGNYSDEEVVAHSLRQDERDCAKRMPKERMQHLREKLDADFAAAFEKAYEACHGYKREAMDRVRIAKKGESWMRSVSLAAA